MIHKYIKLLKKEHIIKYAHSLGYDLTNTEVNFIYDKIKNNYPELINNPNNIFNEARAILRDDVYHKIVNLYQEYKKKLGPYL